MRRASARAALGTLAAGFVVLPFHTMPAFETGHFPEAFSNIQMAADLAFEPFTGSKSKMRQAVQRPQDFDLLRFP